MTLEMSDFTLKIQGMPDERHYSEDNIKFRDDALRALLINHFENVIKTQIILEKGEINESDEFKPWEIADVQFGKAQMKEIVVHQQLASIRKEFLKINVQIKRCENESDIMIFKH